MAVAAAETRDRVPGKEPSDPAFIGLHCCQSAGYSTEPEFRVHKEMIDMPVRGSYPFPFDPDMTGYASKTSLTLGGSGIHMPAPEKRHLPQGSDFHSAGYVPEYQAVHTFMHIRSSEVVVQPRCGVSLRCEPECRVRDRDLPLLTCPVSR